MKRGPPFCAQSQIANCIGEALCPSFSLLQPSAMLHCLLGIVCSCIAFCAIVSAFDVPCALLLTNLQTGLVKNFSAKLQITLVFQHFICHVHYYGRVYT